MNHSNPLSLDHLIVMQEQMREHDELGQMIDYVRSGGFWTAEAVQRHAVQRGGRCEPIYITKFEDHALFIHDGHHRVTATYLGGRHGLREDEYELKDWTYSSYNEVAPRRNYFTPFHPKHEVRMPEFFQFKMKAKAYFERHGFDDTVTFVLSHKSEYCSPRSIRTVAELAAVYNESLLTKGAA